MRFGILGPLVVWQDGEEVPLGGGRKLAVLALLLVHRGEVVSAERLIDALWGERPPPSAPKVLQGYVSQLRRGLPAETITTHGAGYLVDGGTDAAEFERLLDESRGEEPRRAARTLREALGLWRGQPFAGFEYESWAQAEIARLEELRLVALEERIEADLSLGGQERVVPELRALVAEQPLRERLRALLMLALYRSGRQAEALEEFADVRRRLVAELGIEPGPELRDLQRRILAQDPELGPVARPLARVARRAPWILAAGVAVIAAAAISAVLLLSRGGARVAAESLVLLEPTTGKLVDTIPLGHSPAAVAVGAGSTWVLDADDKTITRVDPDKHRVVRTFGIATTPTDVGVGAGALWIGNGFWQTGFAGTNSPASVSRIDPESGLVDATIPLPRGSHTYFQGGGFTQQLLAVSHEAVWAVNPDQTVSRIDPRTNRTVAKIEGLRASGIATGGGEVWAIDEHGVVEIDPSTNGISRRLRVASEGLTSLAVGFGAVWAADPLAGGVWRIEGRRRSFSRAIPLDFGVGWVAVGYGAVWATNEIGDKVYRIDPRTNVARVVARVAAPGGVAVGEDAVWVTAAGAPSADAALPASTCSALYYGGQGKPDVLIVSDLPLQGPRAITQPIVEAIRLVLELRHFKAGRYSVGYQSCDDSTAQAGSFDVYRCFTNAKAYARTPAVVGVVGAYESACSFFEIPVANQAPGGPLAMISPSNTYTGLTRAFRGAPPRELDQLYPSGERNYVRIAGADHLQAVALSEAARRLGDRRIFVAWDGDDDYAEAFASDVREEVAFRGIDVVGAARWDSHARSFTGFGRRVASARPEAVLLVGAAPPHVPALLRDLRASVGRDVAVVASDGFADLGAPGAALGPSANGIYVANYGIPNRRLPPEGQRFLRRFEAGGGEPSPDFSAAYGAQAAEILLDAIARSDGSRSSVTRELFRTNVENGILGHIRFDENGDLAEAPFTIFRILGGRSVVDRVVTASLKSVS